MGNESLTSQIVNKADIIEVISSYGIDLIKTGRSYKALCPFHDDKNPSMSVSPDKQIFKCFSCGVAGNAVDFILRYENQVNKNTEFKRIDAIKKVAEICNVKVDIKNNNFIEETRDYFNQSQRQMANINKNINKVFTYYLTSTELGKEALDYLYQRGLSDEIIRDLEIGFCPENSALINEKNFVKAYQVGLAKENENEKYETLRDRITFPIKNDKGDIVGYSGRIMSADKSKIKYLNTEENSIFKKGDILYNFDDAKKHIDVDGIYLVEGYMDVIAAKSIGINNVSALMGTALTDAHINHLKEFNSPVNLMLDSDEPGRNAMLKSIDLLEKNGIDVRVVDLKTLGSLKDIGEYHEFVVQNSNKDNLNEKLIALKQIVIQSKEKAIVFKIKRYLENLGLEKDIHLVNIEDIYQKFNNQIKGSNKLAVMNYLESVSSCSHDEIYQVLNPVNKNYDNFVIASVNKALDELFMQEISKKEDVILKNYYLQHKDSILNKANILLQEDGSLLYQDGVVNTSNLLNTILRENKQYEQFKDLNTFKYQTLFDHCYNGNSENKIQLSKGNQYKFVEKYNLSFLNDELDEKGNISEAYIIDKIDDLFDILPVKMMNQLQFKEIQRDFYNKKMICFDFNTIFDAMQLKMGILDYFDKSYKIGNQLKAILIYPNQDQSIKIKDKKLNIEMGKNEKNKTKKNVIENMKDFSKSNLHKHINVFVKLIQKETEKGFYFKAGRNDDRYYFAPKEICNWYGKDKRTLKISIDNIGKISEYSFNPETNKFAFVSFASYKNIEKDFKIFEKEMKNDQKKKTTYMIFKEYDVNSIQKNGISYAVISIPYKNETATMMIPFSYMHKNTDGMISFKVREDWTYTLDLNGIKERRSPNEIIQLYNYDRNDKLMDISSGNEKDTNENLERSEFYG